jgi:hypothetical protein
MKPKLHVLAALLMVGGLAACATPTPPPPPPTEAPPPTATATPRPTDTPVPTATPTATPVPYGLTVSVADADGNAVPGAMVALAEMHDEQQVSDDGQVSWQDLPGEAASLSVRAQGYVAAKETVTLERGPNEVQVALERDPFGVLPAEACGPGESLAYLEDFQDGRTLDWPTINFQTAGWSIADDPEQPGNIVAISTNAQHPFEQMGQTQNDRPSWDNAVWRLRLKMTGARRQVSLNWRYAPAPYSVDAGQVDDSRYQIILGTADPTGARRVQIPVLNVGLADSAFRLKADTWYLVEISTFDGHVELWVDGKKILQFTDPNPIPPGGIGLEAFDPAGEGDSAVYFDNLTVCELSDAFAPLPTPEPTPTEG